MTNPPHNWQVYGHDWAVDHLRRSLRNERTRHAYLFAGVDAIGKRTLAYNLALALNAPSADGSGNIDFEQRAAKRIMSGNHPDIVIAKPDEDSDTIKIDAVREITNKLALKPYEARYRMAIIPNFERIRGEAQDALLKTLEEPAESSLLVLLANSTENILATITSRSQVMNLRLVPADIIRDVLIRNYGIAPPDADLMARVSGGRIGWAICAATEEGNPLWAARNQALSALEDLLRNNRAYRFDVAATMGKDKQSTLASHDVLDLWLTYWRDVLLLTLNSSISITNIDHEETIRKLAGIITPDDALKALRATRITLNLVRRTNTNPRHAFEVMMLDYPGLAH